VVQKGVKIEPASGKLGVLIPGLGAVSTTFIAGVEAIKQKIAQPVGSLTQLGTIRLGKRTERRVPKIHDFVPLAGLSDLVFGGWDIYEDNCYESASKAGVLEKSLLDAVRPQIEKNQTVESRFQPGLRQTPAGTQRQIGQDQDGACRAGDGRHRAVSQD
jgi:myo-inositol-1-phosphate synthase